MSRPSRLVLSVAAAVLSGLAACDGTGPQLAPVSLYLTDAPSDQIASARVWISRAYLVPGSDDTDGPGFTITDDPQEYDLLQLQNGVTALLGNALIPVGDYAQLRLVVDSAKISLVDGATFADGSSARTLKVPSGMQSGIKVSFPGKVHVDPAGADIVVDFDVTLNFTFQGAPDALRDVLFTPLLKGTVQ
ncbi:MAG: DUF4382 domain-containing protein [Gemmatimonadales bacterium]